MPRAPYGVRSVPGRGSNVGEVVGVVRPELGAEARSLPGRGSKRVTWWGF